MTDSFDRHGHFCAIGGSDLWHMRSGPICAIFWTGVSPACAADPLYQTLLYFGKFCTDDVSLL